MIYLAQISKRIGRKFNPLLFFIAIGAGLNVSLNLSDAISNGWDEKSAYFILVIEQEV